MKKLAIALILALALSLPGCSLLREDSEPPETDRLVGVYITESYIDTFDFEAYFQDNASSLSGGGEISREDTEKYSQRIYAEVVDGKTSFPIVGVPLIAARYEKDGESYTGSDCGDKLADVHLSINNSDDMVTTVLTGEIFTDSGSGRVTAYCNPVYQQADGRIYLVPGEGMTADSGGSMVFSLSDSRESAVEGEQGYGMEITLTATGRYPSDKLAVLLYSADGELMGRTEYAPEDMPEEIAADGAAWAVFEDYTRDFLGEPQVIRRLIAACSDEGFLSLHMEPGEVFYTPRTTYLK
ncbi:MAG TPA: hypothetical protein IAD42_09315 [Candidatus Scatomorpha pullistercoris]|uniref:Lipoprotein n=1 Tax=Candidatus Scatomorpha pullistercoris TaxID=2840929 RepID=A0A9D1G5X7_9FIRM|nr:hypothetical protein [Candidatus Scatomorpha pullistercoris]